MPALTDVPRNSEERRAFLQSPAAGFGRILAAFVLGFYAFANSAAMLHPLATWRDWIQPLNILVLAAGLICAAVWGACVVKQRSASELETIDTLATIATASCIGLTAMYGPPVHRPELAAIMGVVIFLILRAIVIPSAGPRTAILSAISSASTTTASLTGTPLYLSPESITAPDRVDGRSDLYAVGGVAFWLLTGTHVFEGNTVVEVCSHHLHTKPDSPSERLGAPVPSDLEAVILRCLEKDPAKRYANAEALSHALDACESVDDWSDDLAAAWWKLHKTEADEAKPKVHTTRSRMPGPIDIDLHGRGPEREERA